MEQSYQKAFPNLTSPYRIKNLVYKNRFYTAPHGMHTVQADEEYPTDRLLKYYIERARGGAACVTLSGFNRNGPDYRDDLHVRLNLKAMEDGMKKRGYRRFVDAMHYYGAAASIQMGFQGYKNKEGFMTGPCDLDAIGFGGQRIINKAATYEDILASIEEVAQTALVIRNLGFDMISFMGGHGTSMAQWVNPNFNKRTDEFGGSPENRARLPMMMFDRIREVCGEDFLIEYRMSGFEYEEDSPSIEDTAAYARLIQDHVDILHVSCGTNFNPETRCIIHPSDFLPPAPNAYLAKAMKDGGVHIPVMAVGGIHNPEQAEKLIAEGYCDFVTSARGWIADPQLMTKTYRGKVHEVVPCLKCLRCLDDYKDSYFFSCSVNPRAGREYDLEQWEQPVERQQRCAVVGGGPAGLNAALTLAQRGHQVELFEKSDALGGALRFAEHVSFKYDLDRYMRYLIDMCSRQENIRIHLSTEAAPEFIKKQGFDAVFAAVGASPAGPGSLLAPGASVLLPREVFGRYDRIGRRVVVVGGGQTGCEIALHLAMDKGRSVTVVSRSPEVAKDAIFTYRIALMQKMRKHVTMCTATKCTGVAAEGVLTENPEGVKSLLEADTVIWATGSRDNRDAAWAYLGSAPVCKCIGDCITPKNVSTAVRSAYEAAMQII